MKVKYFSQEYRLVIVAETVKDQLLLDEFRRGFDDGRIILSKPDFAKVKDKPGIEFLGFGFDNKEVFSLGRRLRRILDAFVDLFRI